MPPKASFTKKDLVEYGVQVVREEGLAGLSARRLAQQAGSSVAPIYQSFRSMDQMTFAVLRRIKEMALARMHVSYTERHFLNIGMGFALFARDEKALFKALHFDNTEHRELVDELFVDLRDSMLDDPRFADMPDEIRSDLLFKMWTFTLGLSAQYCFGVVHDPTDDEIYQVLHDTGTVVIRDAIQRMQSEDREDKEERKQSNE